MSGKRLDLQGIRGLAILAVLGFHFYPNIFPNGYLGVDQFFVLSGFLMCMLLLKSESKDMPISEMISNFYIRRLKRILPLYQLLILLSSLSLYFLFPVTSIEINSASAQRALLLMSNQLKSEEESYQEMLTNAINIFTHTWSLSVEVQFYLLVPFIFLLPVKKCCFTVITIASFLYFNYLPVDEAFYSVIARIWQFLIGMFANLFITEISSKTKYELLVDNDEHNKEQEIGKNVPYLEYIMISSLVVSIFCPLLLPALWIRPIITLLTGLLIATSSGDNILLSNRFITYLGDISYSLYLIHWPIYSYWKLNRDDNQLELIGFLIFSVLVSILIYETFEKWYTQSPTSTAFILTVLFTASTLAFLHKDQIFNFNNLSNKGSIYHDPDRFDEVTENMTLDDAARLNLEWTTHDEENLYMKTCNYMRTKSVRQQKWCEQSGLDPSNKYKFMILGNSYAPNHVRIVYEECFEKANSMWQQQMFQCEPLYNPPDKGRKACSKNLPATLERLKTYKPDYVFHITRYINTGKEIQGPIEQDPIYQAMLSQTRIYLEHISKKFYILNATPRVHLENVVKIVDQIRSNVSLPEVDKWLVDEQDVSYLRARKRFAQLVKDCGPKCELIDYWDLFYRKDTKTFRFFDEKGFSYLTGFMHLSPHGLEYVRHIYTDICNKI